MWAPMHSTRLLTTTAGHGQPQSWSNSQARLGSSGAPKPTKTCTPWTSGKPARGYAAIRSPCGRSRSRRRETDSLLGGRSVHLIHQQTSSYRQIQRISAVCHRDANDVMAERPLVLAQASAFISQHKNRGPPVAKPVVFDGSIGRRTNDVQLVELYPAAEPIGRSSHKGLPE